jgi:PAS domain S-box-containing protein
MDASIYRTVFDSFPDGILLLDEHAVITHINGSAARMLGQAGPELLGHSLKEAIPSLDEEYLQVNSTEALHQAGATCRITTQGREVILAVTSAPLEGVSPHKQVLVLRDITASQAAHQLRTYSLANITHEFRTPLSALKASVELILDSLGEVSQAELERLLRSIHYSVASLHTLIDNLLESANIETGSFRIHPQEARLSEVIGEGVRVMSPLLQRRAQGLQIEMDWSLPPLHIDPTRITQVIVNLLSNASKYSPTGKGIRIRVSPSKGDQLLISVIDQGAGLTPHDRENLFQRFVRLNDNTGEQFGVGLGLWVVKAIVEAHGGAVGVDENPEGGSIFWFTLPMENTMEEEL